MPKWEEKLKDSKRSSSKGLLMWAFNGTTVTFVLQLYILIVVFWLVLILLSIYTYLLLSCMIRFKGISLLGQVTSYHTQILSHFSISTIKKPGCDTSLLQIFRNEIYQHPSLIHLGPKMYIIRVDYRLKKWSFQMLCYHSQLTLSRRFKFIFLYFH